MGVRKIKFSQLYFFILYFGVSLPIDIKNFLSKISERKWIENKKDQKTEQNG